MSQPEASHVAPTLPAADQALRQLFLSLRKDDPLTDDAVDRLRKLRSLVQEGLISQEEYEGKKKEWLRSL